MNRLVKIGAIISLISLTLLPIGGCANTSFNGLQVLSSSEIPFLIKFFLFLSIAGAVFSFFAKKEKLQLISGIISAIALLIAYFSGGNYMKMITIKVGFYTSFIGFLIIIFGGLPEEKRKVFMKYFKE